MSLGREKGTFLAVLLLTTWLAFGLFGGGDMRRASRAVETDPDLSALGNVDPILSLGSTGEGRDPFREPREIEAVEPLAIPLPPLDDLAVLLPPPRIDGTVRHWSQALRRDNTPLPEGNLDAGPIQDLAETAAEAETVPGATATGDEDSYLRLYDWVRIDPLNLRWGRLLGADRYSLQPGDPLQFQEVDPRSGADRFAPLALPSGGYEGFGFAENDTNEVELAARSLSTAAHAVPERLRTTRWLLTRVAAVPSALGHAERIAVESVQIAPDDIETWLVLGETWEAGFQLDEAFALYLRMAGESVAGEPPTLPLTLDFGRFALRSEPRIRLAGICALLGLDALAGEWLRAAVALSDGHPEAPLALANWLLARGDVEGAAPLLERAERTGDGLADSARVRQAMGTAALARAEWGAAIERFAEAENAALSASLNEPDHRALWADRMISMRAGQVAAAYLGDDPLRAADLAAQAVSEFGAAPILLELRGLAAAAAGRSASGIVNDLRAAAQADPLTAAPSLAALSYWYERLGVADLADEALADCLELDPDLKYGLYLRARRARESGDLATARTDLELLLAQDPDWAAVLGELGRVEFLEGKYEAAEVAFGRATEASSGWLGMHLHRAWNLLAAGRLGEARTVLAEARAAAGSDPALDNALAWAAYAGNSVESSQDALVRFAQVLDALRDEVDSPQRAYAELWEMRIDYHRRLGRWSDTFDHSGDLAARWTVDARLGIEPRAFDGRLELAGEHRAQGRTRVYREVPAVGFDSYEGRLGVGARHRGTAGLALSIERGKGARSKATWQMIFQRDREGRLEWIQYIGSREERGRLDARIPLNGEAVLGFSLDREQQPPLLALLADGRVLHQVAVPALRSPSGQLRLSCFVETLNAIGVDASLDDVHIVSVQPDVRR